MRSVFALLALAHVLHGALGALTSIECGGAAASSVCKASAAEAAGGNKPIFTVTVNGSHVDFGDDANAERTATQCTGSVAGVDVTSQLAMANGADGVFNVTFPAMSLWSGDAVLELECDNGKDPAYTAFSGTFAPSSAIAAVWQQYACDFDATHATFDFEWADTVVNTIKTIPGCDDTTPVTLTDNVLTAPVLVVHGKFGVLDDSDAFVAATLGDADCLTNGVMCDFLTLGDFGDVRTWVSADGSEFVSMLYNIDTSENEGRTTPLSSWQLEFFLNKDMLVDATTAESTDVPTSSMQLTINVDPTVTLYWQRDDDSFQAIGQQNANRKWIIPAVDDAATPATITSFFVGLDYEHIKMDFSPIDTDGTDAFNKIDLTSAQTDAATAATQGASIGTISDHVMDYTNAAGRNEMMLKFSITLGDIALDVNFTGNPNCTLAFTANAVQLSLPTATLYESSDCNDTAAAVVDGTAMLSAGAAGVGYVLFEWPAHFTGIEAASSDVVLANTSLTVTNVAAVAAGDVALDGLTACVEVTVDDDAAFASVYITPTTDETEVEPPVFGSAGIMFGDARVATVPVHVSSVAPAGGSDGMHADATAVTVTGGQLLADVTEATLVFDVTFTFAEDVEATADLNVTTLVVEWMASDATEYTALTVVDASATTAGNIVDNQVLAVVDDTAVAGTMVVTYTVVGAAGESGKLRISSPDVSSAVTGLTDVFTPTPKWGDMEDFVINVERVGCMNPSASDYDELATVKTVCTYDDSGFDGADGLNYAIEGADGTAFDLQLPAGAFATGSKTLSVTEKTSDQVGGTPASDAVFASAIVQIDVTGTGVSAGADGKKSLDKPAVVRLKVNVPVDSKKEVTTVMYKQTTADPWTPVPGAVYNAATGLVEFSTDHFTIFAVLKTPRPITPDLGGGCDNRCSGHGDCMNQGQCSCWGNWEGPDCSMRTCPYGNAWAMDHDDNGHYYAECSNRGACNHETGECECFDGYTGAACDRSECPNDCSGHGKCRMVSELQADVASSFLGWDGEKVQACECDGGYIGADCSQRLCPKGDDPMTLCLPSPGDHVQRVTFTYMDTAVTAVETDTDQIGLGFVDTYGEEWSLQRAGDLWYTDAATGNTASDNIRQALLNVPNHVVPSVSVQADSSLYTSNSKSFLVTFTSPLNSGTVEDIVCPTVSGCTHAGCQPYFKQMHKSSVTGTGLAAATAFSVMDTSVVELPAGYGPVAGQTDLEVDITWAKRGSVLSYTVDSVTVGGLPVTDSPFLGFRGFIEDVGATEQINLAYGLMVTIDGSNVADTNTNTITYDIAHCSVAEETAVPSKSEDIECSGRGMCNRVSGECECFDGFYGLTCSKSTILI